MSQGVLVAACSNIEFLLPWWWYNYSIHNDLPVVFADLGMTEKAKNFCRKKGRLLDFTHPYPHVGGRERVDNDLAKRWEETHGNDVWRMRSKWFNKPFVFRASPFVKTLWLDLDCEVRGDIRPILDCCNENFQMALTPEIERYQEIFQSLGFAEPGVLVYNSGVVPYITKSPLIEKWVEESIELSHLFISDQDVLSSVISKFLFSVKQMPYEMNWDRTLDFNPSALVVHWHSQAGKLLLLKEIEIMESIGLISL